ncbi:polysaccharide biosynthesis protein [Schnuerera sp. xch1]|uniref:polysaccharide biosynthesis protein n=1 Tax=Schnuerera sp. xch1 TaxID=2874283 RepID=UPI001CBF44F0|nr:nucleoside-diphosphate sugar epimerase/dehydratase [Schnuerera sp. xch1]MBZ2175128.1 polysaccharide biosynthesis protein [Schnuerera sp. xch1]
MQKSKKVILLLIFDVVLINLSYLLALYLRFERNIELRYLETYISNAILLTMIKLAVFHYFKLYKSIWKYASIDELINITAACIVANAGALSFLVIMQSHLPRSVYIMVTILDVMLVGGMRFSVRALRKIKNGVIIPKGSYRRIMIIGGGDAGAMVIREYNNHTQLNSKPVAIIDDDVKKQDLIIRGVPVLGRRDDIPRLAEEMEIDEVIIAIPSADRNEIREIVEVCRQTKCKLKILPGMYELIDGDVSIKKIRDVQIEDLLGRDEVRLNVEEISYYIKGKVVLVTGGGGSIGSELCRQIARFKPKELIILDIYENNAYEIQNELLRTHDDLNLKTVIASVRDKHRIDEIMEKENPEVVFHAAAHKHVPLMEDSPKEAIKNNVFGTLNIARSANEYGVKRFVMISTDKAVNPTNVMGASKRICEMIIQSINEISNTEFVAVRFGNVLGSNGSVIPLFKKQIEEGGPVTVTHPEVVRYFMTIPEAVRLVIQAGAMAKGGEVFVLDMGEPVKIMDLAKDLIKLSGFEPNVDIPIKIIGLRPGEKLFEELLLDEEGISSTEHNKIFIGKPTFFDYKLLLKYLNGLDDIIHNETDNDLKEYLENMVPTYKNKDCVNEQLCNNEIAATKE